MRPLIHPALVCVWRDAGTVQIGLGPERSVVLGGVGAPEAAVLRALDGTVDERELQAVARRAGGPPQVADRLLRLLRSAGVIVDADEAPAARADQHAPDVASLGLVSGALDGGAAHWRARRRAWVEVRGAGRVGATVARLVAAAGVGRVTADDPEPVSPRDIAPGAFRPRDVGRARGTVLESRLPQPPRGRDSRPDLVVLAPAGAAPPDGEALLRAGVPHLPVHVTEATGIVGPLVLPGRSSCLRCQHLHRVDRDRAWPRVVAQSQQHPPAVPACDVTLAALVAALGARQILAHVDGRSSDAVNGTIEVSMTRPLPRRRSWQPHPACGCTWSG